jgi:hypothetical protein
MYKRAKVVMLPTNEKAGTIWLSNTLQLLHTHVSGKYLELYKSQHLYIISGDDIKEDDWITDTKAIYKAPNLDGYIGLYKIIATTDPLLSQQDTEYSKVKNLPQPSQSFIDKYITEYNKSNIIEDVMVEYEVIKDKHCCGAQGFNPMLGDICPKCDNIEPVIFLKLKDNTITIKKIKDSWTRDEVTSLIFKAYNLRTEDKIARCSVDLKTWINRQL